MNKLTSRILILLAITVTGMVAQVHAQRLAQAVMQVSVTIVEASEVEVPHAVQLSLSDRRESDKPGELGSFTITGMENGDTYMELSDQVVLQNEEGEKVRLSVQAAKKLMKRQTLYRLVTTPQTEAFMAGNYRGDYKATLVYN